MEQYANRGAHVAEGPDIGALVNADDAMKGPLYVNGREDVLPGIAKYGNIMGDVGMYEGIQMAVDVRPDGGYTVLAKVPYFHGKQGERPMTVEDHIKLATGILEAAMKCNCGKH